ncbi:peptide/nickel transport system substrate-binding protein [Variovorax sp. YR750]|uniref:ABC transporter substrate-binding protein n=1 Tax=Variovorax sp. YR750 TaxID=1884384 RepID=UPI0008AD4CED|nr:ABC transporter substrate-binding protein [Variovorax sp. YR750]SEM04855.1 peptide/nickel transport system substrate-binding protein [Variovorax sp. YR750]
MKYTRRQLFRDSTLMALAAASARPDFNFLIGSAFAQNNSALTILSAENLTGNWDPSSHTTLAQMNLEGYVFGYLTRAPMRLDNPDQLQMELAKEIKIVDSGTIAFKIRDDVKFHDGTPLTADDFKATFEYASQPSRPAQWYPGQCKVNVLSKHAFEVKTGDFGYPAALFYFLSSFLPVMSAKDIKSGDMVKRPNGTGPFRFVAQKGNNTVLEANPNFFAGKPKIQTLNYSFVGDATTRTLALMSGQAHLIERLEAEQVASIEKDPRFKVNKAVSVENKYLWFRCSKAPFNDVRIRQAVCHAIDRKQILEVLGISGAQSNAHISPVKFGYTDVAEYPEYDPAKCQQLLAAAGFPKGKGLPPLEYITSVGFYPKTKEYGELITSMLQEQGFQVSLNVMEIAAWNERLYDRPGGGPGHMIDCGWSTGSPEPDLVLRTHFHSSSKRICGIVDKELDATLDKERNAATPAERKKILQKETLPMLARKVPAYSLFTSVFIHAMVKDLEGLYVYPNGMIDLSKASRAGK